MHFCALRARWLRQIHDSSSFIGESMKPINHYRSRYSRATPVVLLPPNLEAIGPLAFTAAEFDKLDALLAEEGWPHGRMDAAMLEGYLVALIVWPVELSPGAWLPPIWGISGWKVAAKIATRETYDTFLMLVIGFVRELESRLAAEPRRRTLVLGRDAPVLSARYFVGAAWATGFMMALQQNAAGLGSRSTAVRSAVESIAGYASLRSAELTAMPAAATALSIAAATLMAERPSRGPLGPLPLSDVLSGRRGKAAPGAARTTEHAAVVAPIPGG
jgi:yecA family protein